MSDEKDQLSAEIDSALDGMNLQEVDLPQRQTPGAKPGPGAASPSEGEGSRLTDGTIVGVNGDDVIVELGPRSQGVISSNEFEEEPKVGEVYKFSIQGKDPESDLWMLSRKEALVLAHWQELRPGAVIKGKVTGQNTGGLELSIGPIRAFMPASHVALKRVEDLSTLIGETMVVEVIEIDPGKKRCTVSRRGVLERERELQRAETMETLTSGQVVRGTVQRVESFGAFVEIAPGVEGLLHVSNMSRKRVEDPNEVMKVGDVFEVMVLEIQEGGKRIGLGRKQLEPDPWDDAVHKYRENSVVSGKVVRLMDFGAFVEIEPGLEGLLHVSQLGNDHVRHVRDHVKVGQEVVVRVITVERDRERISLSRLDERGAVLGSEDAADAGTIDEIVKQSDGPALGTNLGSLFKKALGDEDG